ARRHLRRHRLSKRTIQIGDDDTLNAAESHNRHLPAPIDLVKAFSVASRRLAADVAVRTDARARFGPVSDSTSMPGPAAAAIRRARALRYARTRADCKIARAPAEFTFSRGLAISPPPGATGQRHQARTRTGRA